MLARFQAAGSVAVFNRAPQPGGGRVGRVIASARLLMDYLRSLRQSPAGSGLYIGLSGGLGQLKDLPYLMAARGLGRPVVVHHHSFAYLRAQPWYARWVMGLLRDQRHIALCDCMADALANAYRVPRAQIDVISNAAFLATEAVRPMPTAVGRAAPGPKGLTLGFLSNITGEKGIWAFFELGDWLTQRGVPVQARVAGPVAPDISERFQRELAQRPWCQHLGPVYGPAKSAFFRDITVLVFPTFYANEAEPVTVLEALAAGVPVIANARGCILDMLPAGAGLVFQDDAQFVALAGNQLQLWMHEEEARWQARSQAAQLGFAALQSDHSQRLAALVQCLMPSPRKAA